MSDVRQRLEEKMEQIQLQRRIESGNVLSIDDLGVIFKILRESDQELTKMIDSMEILCKNSLKTDYMMVETQIKSIFGYYSLIDKYDIIKSRHQYFFTEERKLVKKPYFNQPKLENVKDQLRENNIFRKMGLSNEI